MEPKKLMKCGCVAQGVTTKYEGKIIDPPIPTCLIHECMEEADEQPSLEGRKARCGYGKDGGRYKHHTPYAETESKYTLPFFKYCPDQKYDDYYCGCYGWD